MIYEIRRTVRESCLVDCADQEEANALGAALAEERVLPPEDGCWIWDGAAFEGAELAPDDDPPPPNPPSPPAGQKPDIFP